MPLSEAAKRLGVHYMTAYRYVRTGVLEARQLHDKWMITEAELRKFQRAAEKSGLRTPRGKSARNRLSRLLARLVEGDERGAWAILEEALVSGMTTEEVVLDLLGASLAEIGNLWSDSKVSIAQEHCATQTATRILGRMSQLFSHRGRTKGSVVIATPPGERHALPLTLAGLLLKRAGFKVKDLGSDLPAEELTSALFELNDLVAVAIGVTCHGLDQSVAKSLSAARRGLRARGSPALVLAGGAGISDERHARSLGADRFSGHDARELLQALSTLS
jgi:excisionase family DNA binding protein